MMSVVRKGALLTGALLGSLVLAACGSEEDGQEGDGIVALAGVDQASEGLDPASIAKPGGPLMVAVDLHVTIYEEPDRRSTKVGYLRLGTSVVRGEKPARLDGCQGGFYNILPRGFVCVDDGGAIDLKHPLVRANLKVADRTKPLPYSYAFVRAISPRYYRLPTYEQQRKNEMGLKKHLRVFKLRKKKWNAIMIGSNDVPLGPLGDVLGRPPEEPPPLTENEKFGGDAENGVPWFFDGKRKIPNVSSYKVPDYAIITNRIKRHSGVSLLDAFEGDRRRFALTTDLRLIPTSKLKPGRGSTFHGVELDGDDGWTLPVGFVKRDDVHRFQRRRGKYKRRERVARHTPLQLTGEAKRYGKYRWVEDEDGYWYRQRDVAVVTALKELPRFAKDEVKWIDVAIQRQTLMLYEGDTPVYATMVSTGRGGMGDPKKTHSTPRGTFRIRDKHVTSTMDSEVVGSRFELQDVPWVQYFKSGYALHAAYWHTEFGHPRSHGCINMSPIDAFRTFWWTSPDMPDKWHGVTSTEAAGEGTRIHIHP